MDTISQKSKMSNRNNKVLKLSSKLCDSLVHCRLLENSPETRTLDQAFVTKILVIFFDKIGIDTNKIEKNFPHNLLWPSQKTMDDIIRCINLFCALSNLIKEIGLDDSQLEDILVSDTGHWKILQHICDFYYFYHDEYNYIKHFLTGIEYKRTQINNIEQKIEEYKTKLMEMIIEKQQTINENQSLREDIGKMQSTLMEDNQTKLKIQDELDFVRSKQEQDEQSLINYQLKLEQLDNLKASLEQKLESYPVAYNDELKQLCKAEDNKRNEELSLQQMIAQKTDVLRNKEALLDLISRLINDSCELSRIQQEYHDTKSEDEMMSAKITHLVQRVCESKTNNEKGQLQNHNLNEELTNVKRQCQRTINELNNARQNIFNKIERMRCKVTESLEKKRQVIKEIKLLEDDSAKVKAETDRLVKECQEICKKEMAEVM